MAKRPTVGFKHLVSGGSYRIIREFMDFDGSRHPVGELWLFLGSSFLPYDDGLSLFVQINGVEHQIRLQWRDDHQGPVIDRLADYVGKANEPPEGGS